MQFYGFYTSAQFCSDQYPVKDLALSDLAEKGSNHCFQTGMDRLLGHLIGLKAIREEYALTNANRAGSEMLGDLAQFQSHLSTDFLELAEVQ